MARFCSVQADPEGWLQRPPLSGRVRRVPEGGARAQGLLLPAVGALLRRMDAQVLHPATGVILRPPPLQVHLLQRLQGIRQGDEEPRHPGKPRRTEKSRNNNYLVGFFLVSRFLSEMPAGRAALRPAASTTSPPRSACPARQRSACALWLPVSLGRGSE